MKTIAVLLSIFSLLTSVHAQNEKSKAEIIVGNDGFPTGKATPEGAACDLVRAFINSDVDLLKKTCLLGYGSGKIGDKYNAFLNKIVAGTEEEKTRSAPHPKTPKAFGKVFAARFLTRNGPGSYGYAVHDFDDVMFVDIGAFLHDESRFLNRTLVVRIKGDWFVHPCPTIDTLLSVGLNEEADSTVDFKVKYTIAGPIGSGWAALESGDYSRAVEDFNEALRLNPESTNIAYRWRGRALAGAGDHKKAIADFSRVILDARVPVEIRANYILYRATSHQKNGDDSTAVSDFEAALKLRPESPAVLNDFAWLLATTPNKKIRDGVRSVTLATQAVKMLGSPSPSILDTLAASYAAKGEFKLAVKTQEKAIALSDTQIKRGELVKRLDLYKKNQPYVDVVD
ncbi:MAG: tetratricopeptide repeat protein [Verrucomicrobiales bacterium]|nr:tetratricopeptide repeat protein [Verrucomicrobiales bacterium]